MNCYLGNDLLHFFAAPLRTIDLFIFILGKGVRTGANFKNRLKLSHLSLYPQTKSGILRIWVGHAAAAAAAAEISFGMLYLKNYLS